MDSSGRKIGAPLLALLLVGVVGVAVRFAPVGAPAEPSVSQNPTAERSVPGTFSSVLGAPADLLERASTFGIETILPPTGSLRSFPASDAPPVPSFIGQKQAQIRVLSDREVFNILHPPYYLDYLSTIEDLMVRDGRMGQSEKQVFDSEDKVIAFLKDKVFDYMVLKGVASSVDRERFERGLATVQELHRNEANILRYGLGASQHRFLAFWESVGVLDVFSGLIAPRAQAQGECYREGKGGPQQGSNLGAICCDCTISGVPVGCLNAVCSGQPAIFDTTTYICGCNT